ATGPRPRRAHAGGAGGPRPGRPHGAAGVPAARPRRARPRAHPPAGPGPRPLGPAPAAARPRGPGARRTARAARPLHAPASSAACHARARTAEETDWVRIAFLYGQLSALMPTPVVELNRAVAISMAYGPAAALPLVDALLDEPSLRSYHLLPSVRGDLLVKLG